MSISPKLKLHGFNNLTKSLSFNMYDICYAKTDRHRREYIEYIDEAYNATRLTDILRHVTHIIDANILSIAYQDYDPQGASVTMLIAEKIDGFDEIDADKEQTCKGPLADAVVGHLDKSHITVHTYPESHPYKGISTFRADIDVSTCGVISPLKALNYLLRSFETDIVTLDYRVRGFTRDVDGDKVFIDHEINSIQHFITQAIRDKFEIIDVNVYQENLFHSKLLLKDFNIDDYLFGAGIDEFSDDELSTIKKLLSQEMLEIFYGRNIT